MRFERVLAEAFERALTEEYIPQKDVATWRDIERMYADAGKHHCLRLSCVKCGNVQTCRCREPKEEKEGICPYCTGELSESINESKCPACGQNAYVGFREVECSNPDCKNFKPSNTGLSNTCWLWDEITIDVTSVKFPKKFLEFWRAGRDPNTFMIEVDDWLAFNSLDRGHDRNVTVKDSVYILQGKFGKDLQYVVCWSPVSSDSARKMAGTFA